MSHRDYRYLIFLAVFFIPSVSLGGYVINPFFTYGGAGGGLAAIYDPDPGGGTYATNTFYGPTTPGQVITVAGAGSTITALGVEFGTIPTNQTITLRIGTSLDLTTYLQTVDVAVTSADSGTEVIFTLPSSVTGSTTYYVAFKSSNGLYANRAYYYRWTGITGADSADGSDWLQSTNGTRSNAITAYGSD